MPFHIVQFIYKKVANITNGVVKIGYKGSKYLAEYGIAKTTIWQVDASGWKIGPLVPRWNCMDVCLLCLQTDMCLFINNQ